MNKPHEKQKGIRLNKPQPAPAPPVPEVPLASLPKLTQAVEENMAALSALMEDELKFLAAQDVNGLSGLREKKAKLLREYQAHVMVFAQKPALLQGAPEETRARLRETGKKLADVSARSAKSLTAAISATKSILDLVISAAREEVKKPDCYTDPRKKGSSANAYSPLCAPVAVDRTA